jgi:hypothetical protein
MADLLANFTDYESQLIKLENVTFDEGPFTASNGTKANIPIHQDISNMICRNNYNTITGFDPDTNADYDVTGFAVPFNADKQIAPRDVDDIVLSPVLHIPVTGITGVPAETTAGATLTLTSTVVPEEATNNTIAWSIFDDCGTNSSLTSPNSLTSLNAGTVTVTATIVDGIAPGIPYTQNFIIAVKETTTDIIYIVDDCANGVDRFLWTDLTAAVSILETGWTLDLTQATPDITQHDIDVTFPITIKGITTETYQLAVSTTADLNIENLKTSIATNEVPALYIENATLTVSGNNEFVNTTGNAMEMSKDLTITGSGFLFSNGNIYGLYSTNTTGTTTLTIETHVFIEAKDVSGDGIRFDADNVVINGSGSLSVYANNVFQAAGIYLSSPTSSNLAMSDISYTTT